MYPTVMLALAEHFALLRKTYPLLSTQEPKMKRAVLRYSLSSCLAFCLKQSMGLASTSLWEGVVSDQC